MHSDSDCQCDNCRRRRAIVEQVQKAAEQSGIPPENIHVEAINGLELMQHAFQHFAYEGEMADFLFKASVGWVAGTLRRQEMDAAGLSQLGSAESRKVQGLIQRFVCDMDALFVGLAKEGERRALERN